jgi:hypothetical protein
VGVEEIENDQPMASVSYNTKDLVSLTRNLGIILNNSLLLHYIQSLNNLHLLRSDVPHMRICLPGPDFVSAW